MRKVVFFDRDDTLIKDYIYLNDPEKLTFLPYAFECLKNLKEAGFDFVIVTNQSGIARGLVEIKNMNEIHRRMRDAYAKIGVDILEFSYAPYLPVTDHYLRKPNPGMLEEAAFKYRIDLKRSWMVGDRMTDVEAGHRAGTRTILLSGKESPEGSPYSPPEYFVDTLQEVCEAILKNN